MEKNIITLLKVRPLKRLDPRRPSHLKYKAPELPVSDSQVELTRSCFCSSKPAVVGIWHFGWYRGGQVGPGENTSPGTGFSLHRGSKTAAKTEIARDSHSSSTDNFDLLFNVRYLEPSLSESPFKVSSSFE